LASRAGKRQARVFRRAAASPLRRIVGGIITQDAVDQGRTWKLTNHQRQKIRHAIFGAGMAGSADGELSPTDRKELFSEFTKKVVDPLIETLPKEIAAWAVLMVYEEFVDAVFIQPFWEKDIGGGD
jgi:hypothetical protein